MSWNQNTSNHTEYCIPGLLSGTVGSLMIAFSPAYATDVVPPAQTTSRGIAIINGTVAYTQRSSTIKVGLLQNNQTTLLSGSAKEAIGPHGLKRLINFFDVQAGWDGLASKPIDLCSVDVFSRFFADTRLCPERLGIFMSAQGNVVVNWPGQDGQLIELEFHSGGVDYFIESTGDEGAVTVDDVGFSKLARLISESVAA